VQGFDVDTDVLHRAANDCRRIMDDITELSSAGLLAGRRRYGDAGAISAADDFAARYGYATGVMAQLVGAHGDDLDASSFSYGEVDGVAACVFQPES
jgi:hypothetical protein